MSQALIRRNHEGVVLRYADPRELRPYHAQRKRQPGDRLRCAILRSEREIRYLRVMLAHLEDEISEVALNRFDFALRTIEAVLNLARAELGLYVEERRNTE